MTLGNKDREGDRQNSEELRGTPPDSEFVRIKIPYLKDTIALGGLLQTYQKGGGKKWQEEDAEKTHGPCPREKRLAPHSSAGTTSVACPNSGCNPHQRNRSANISLLDDIPPSVEQPFILNPLWKPFPKQLKEPSAFHNREEFFSLV